MDFAPPCLQTSQLLIYKSNLYTLIYSVVAKNIIEGTPFLLFQFCLLEAFLLWSTLLLCVAAVVESCLCLTLSLLNIHLYVISTLWPQNSTELLFLAMA